MWGDELAAPGSYLADLLSSSAPPSVPPALEDTQRVIVERDPDEEAFLSSAPKPYGTTSFDLDVKPPRSKHGASILWTSLGLIALALIGVVASAMFRDPPNVASQQQRVPVFEGESKTSAESPAELPFIGPEAPPEQPIAETPTLESEPPKAKPKKKRRRTKPKPSVSPRPSASQSPPVVLEPDEGIDWTVPGFPEETGNPEQSSGAPVVIDSPPSP